jgi:hypothetical protein
MTKAKQAKKLRAINSENRTFWRTTGARFEKLAAERPQAISDALADFEDEARRRGLRGTPALEHFAERVSKRTLSSKKRGRPQGHSAQRAELRERIAQLKQEHSWSEVSRKLADEGTHLSPGACRYYLAK